MMFTSEEEFLRAAHAGAMLHIRVLEARNQELQAKLERATATANSFHEAQYGENPPNAILILVELLSILESP